MYKLQNFKSKLIAGASATMLAASLCAAAAVPALAAPVEGNNTGNTGDTDVTLKADESQMRVVIPTTLAGAIDGNGDISYGDLLFENQSIFAIHVDKATVTDANGYSVVKSAEFGTTTANNAVQTTLTPATGTAADLGSMLTQTELQGWNMTKDGTQGDILTIDLDGAIKNVTNNITVNGEHAYTIAWILAAGTDA